MGAAWIQAKGPNPGSTFQARVSDWPSAYKAEITAIAAALLSVPINSTVQIFTDSQSCVTTFKKLSLENPRMTHKRWIKKKHWSLWLRIKDLIKIKNLQISLSKVKAHSGDHYNEIADQLAKQACNEPVLQWYPLQSPVAPTIVKWHDHDIEISVRDFIKTINSKENAIRWTTQNRTLDSWGTQVTDQDKYSWSLTWELLNPKGTFHTSFKDTKDKSFSVNLINNELPTLTKLTI
jgi:ribonuclease HI